MNCMETIAKQRPAVAAEAEEEEDDEEREKKSNDNCIDRMKQRQKSNRLDEEHFHRIFRRKIARSDTLHTQAHNSLCTFCTKRIPNAKCI